MYRFLKLLAWTLVAVPLAKFAATWLMRQLKPPPAAVVAPPVGTHSEWFTRNKQYCNTLEVAARMATDPPPASVPGAGVGAACYALAGHIDSARAVITRLAPNDRYLAAGFVFDVAHPVADMGDDKAAGPMMELVVEFWPNHYMALYHAGASAYQLGRYADAGKLLKAFLATYNQKDGWTASAQQMIRELTHGRKPARLAPVP